MVVGSVPEGERRLQYRLRQSDLTCMKVTEPSLASIIQDAFERFGASLLWNVRRSSAGVAPDAEYVSRIARKLAREGRSDAVSMARRMLSAVEVGHPSNTWAGSSFPEV